MSQYICYHEAEFCRGQLEVIALGDDSIHTLWSLAYVIDRYYGEMKVSCRG